MWNYREEESRSIASLRADGALDDGSFDYNCERCQDSGIFMIDLDDMGEQAGIDYCSCKSKTSAK